MSFKPLSAYVKLLEPGIDELKKLVAPLNSVPVSNSNQFASQPMQLTPEIELFVPCNLKSLIHLWELFLVQFSSSGRQ